MQGQSHSSGEFHLARPVTFSRPSGKICNAAAAEAAAGAEALRARAGAQLAFSSPGRVLFNSESFLNLKKWLFNMFILRVLEGQRSSIFPESVLFSLHVGGLGSKGGSGLATGPSTRSPPPIPCWPPSSNAAGGKCRRQFFVFTGSTALFPLLPW